MSFASHFCVASGGEGTVEGSIGPEPRGGMSPASSEGFGGSGGEASESWKPSAIVTDKAEMADNGQGWSGGSGTWGYVFESPRLVTKISSSGYCSRATAGSMRDGGKLDGSAGLDGGVDVPFPG